MPHQTIEGAAIQAAIEQRAVRGTPECPNGCGLAYHPMVGHLRSGYVISRDEEHCLGLLNAGLELDRHERTERARLVELGQRRRHAIVFWVSLLLFAVLMAAMVTVGTSDPGSVAP